MQPGRCYGFRYEVDIALAHTIRIVAISGICALAIVGVLVRPFKIPEWMWALGCALAVAITGLLPLADLGQAIGAGTDVYLFLAGMMVLSEIARRAGVFDWVAVLAVRASGGSQYRLFALVYSVGIIVTTVLSNDATAVVLTPAVAAAVRTARVNPLPYLFACALIANAASFVLPISNPANLVVFANALPPLPKWVGMFGLPSICSIAITYGVLILVFRKTFSAGDADASGEAGDSDDNPRDAMKLALPGRLALSGIGLTALALVLASNVGANLGAVTLVAALGVYLAIAVFDRAAIVPIVRSVSWSVLILVAGLFVLVSAAEKTGLLNWTRSLASQVASWPEPLSLASAAFGTGISSNLINNLPAGLIAGTTIAGQPVGDAFRGAVAIGIDLGPNLSVTGSLATILWLLALRREKIDIDAWHFLRVGALAMPVALLCAVESLLVTLR